MMPSRSNLARFSQIWRYYQAGAINALVGFGLYSLMLRLGLNMYAAQIIAHILGVAFNYYSYSRHVFSESAPAMFRFTLSYAVNYFISLVMLALVSFAVNSPYIAGFLSIILASAINYFALKYFVFVRRVSK